MEKPDESAVKKLAIAVGAFAASYLLKTVLESAYERIYDEDPPNAIKDEHVNWGRVIGWTIVTGLATNALKILVKRGSAHYAEID